MKSGFAAILGRPNVGKSTLMNRLIDMKIAITSSRAQTTRKEIKTVFTDDRGQIVFLDTPGITRADSKLGEYMYNVAVDTLKTADVVMWLVEPTTYIGGGERKIIEILAKASVPVLLVMTSNAPDTMYLDMITNYQQTLSRFVGPTEVFVSGNTLQLKDYSKTDWEWSMFDPAAKQKRHETVFPEECRKGFEMGAMIAE